MNTSQLITSITNLFSGYTQRGAKIIATEVRDLLINFINKIDITFGQDYPIIEYNENDNKIHINSTILIDGNIEYIDGDFVLKQSDTIRFDTDNTTNVATISLVENNNHYGIGFEGEYIQIDADYLELNGDLHTDKIYIKNKTIEFINDETNNGVISYNSDDDCFEINKQMSIDNGITAGESIFYEGILVNAAYGINFGYDPALNNPSLIYDGINNIFKFNKSIKVNTLNNGGLLIDNTHAYISINGSEGRTNKIDLSYDDNGDSLITIVGRNNTGNKTITFTIGEIEALKNLITN